MLRRAPDLSRLLIQPRLPRTASPTVSLATSVLRKKGCVRSISRAFCLGGPSDARLPTASAFLCLEAAGPSHDPCLGESLGEATCRFPLCTSTFSVPLRIATEQKEFVCQASGAKPETPKTAGRKIIYFIMNGATQGDGKPKLRGPHSGSRVPGGLLRYGGAGMWKRWRAGFHWRTLELGHLRQRVSTGSSWTGGPVLLQGFWCSSCGRF